MKRLFLPIGLAILLVASLLAGAGFLATQATPARAQFEVTSPEVTGTTVVQVNQLYVLTASGYSANDQLDITFNGSRLFNGRADGSGQITGTAKIPMLPFGSYVVRSVNQNSIAATYTAAISPFILTTVGGGAVGNPLRVEGVGFGASERVTVTFRSVVTCTGTEEAPDDAEVSESLGVVTATHLGTWRINTTVPDVEDGTYYVGALGQTSDYCTVAN